MTDRPVGLKAGRQAIRPGRLLPYGVALLSVTVALALTLMLAPWLRATPSQLFFVAVLVSAFYGGWSSGLMATGLSTLAINYFFVEPGYSLVAPKLGTAVPLIVFVISALLISGLNESRRRVIRREQSLRTVSDTAQREAQAAKERLDTVLSSISEAFYVLDRHWCFTYVNAHLCKMIALQHDQILGRSVWALLPDAVGTELERQFHRALDEQTPIHAEYFYAPWNRWYNHRIYPTPSGLTIFATDITEAKYNEINRKQAEAALQQSEERLRLALVSASQGLYDLNVQTGETIVSPEYAQMLGYDPEEFQETNAKWRDRLHPDDVETVYQAYEDYLSGKLATYRVEFRQQTKSGDWKWILSLGKIVSWDSDGRPLRMLGTHTDITDRKQVEVEREQLLRREQATREAAEAAEQRARFVVEANETLASSLDYEFTLKSVAQAVVPTLADWCAVDILKDDGTLERLATAHVDPAKMQWGIELHRRYPPDLNAPRGVAQVLRTGKPEYYPTISDDLLVVTARDQEHLEILRTIGFSSVMLVPLNARGRTLGTISFVAAESGRSYDPDDLSLAEELAHRAAIALDNARLYQEAQQARQMAERAGDRTSRLQTVTAALSESLTPEQVAEVIVEQSMDVLEATAALVVVVSPDRTELEIIKSTGYTNDLVESWRRFPITADVPLANAIRTGEPAWAETMLDRIAQYPHLAEVYKRYDFNAWIALPLVVEGKSVGGILLSFREFQPLNQDDREFVLALTRQCAQAIVRAQLYAAEQQARAEAESANRIKDEFLAVLSHELRSPLNPILGWSKLLQSGQLDPEKTQQALKTIERNAHLQAELIEDLLDVSRILQGKLSLNISAVNLGTIIQAAMETVRLAADAKAIAVEANLEPDVGLVSGDATRLQQVIWNLLSNAVKFTPKGGQLRVRLERLDLHATIVVSDTGQGIAPEFLPYVFDYFRQADGATTRKFGGLGLGLAIVRHLVELHGGTVQADSPGEGQGATFTVRLPLMPAQTEQPPSLGVPDSALDLRGMSILVVDDDDDTRALTTFLLEQAGAQVTAARSASDALGCFTQVQPDLLLSDIGMPDMDGYMLLRQVRALPPDQGGTVPAIAITAYAGEIDQQQALAAGFQRHLAKPLDPEALLQAIAVLLHPVESAPAS